MQLRLLPEHQRVRGGAGEGDRRDADKGGSALRKQGLSEGLQLPQDRLPEEVLRVLQPRSGMQRLLQVLQLRKLQSLINIYLLAHNTTTPSAQFRSKGLNTFCSGCFLDYCRCLGSMLSSPLNFVDLKFSMNSSCWSAYR